MNVAVFLFRWSYSALDEHHASHVTGSACTIKDVPSLPTLHDRKHPKSAGNGVELWGHMLLPRRRF